uniref:non-specific serine/threonine protein kinase n=1 Tax=Araucaria cunninghamii TaxID=56994 RepID=A0A0D6R486_ARACU
MEFAVEVEVLGRLKHKNLLSLRGYCAEGQERLIVYDYMPNSSLHAHLHGQYARNSLHDWPKRMNIAIGSAEGLEYLHHHVKPHIIHRDVKASNVLLDSNFQAQVADFGFARLIPDGATHVTTRVKGTLGYLAPEYAMWGKASESCDMYSFGIMLLELVSGKKPIEKLGPGDKCTLASWAAPLVLEGRYNKLVDPKLLGRYNRDELERVVLAATACSQSAPEKRPKMHDVVSFLKGGSKENFFKTMNGSQDGKLKLDVVNYEREVLEADCSSASNSASASNTASASNSASAANGDAPEDKSNENVG